MILLFVVGFVQRHKAKKFWVKVEFDFSDCAMAVFCDNKFGYICWDEIIVVLFVVIWTVEEHDKVGVLLDRTRFTKVGKDWTRIVAAGNATRELGEGDNWDFELTGENLEATRNFGDLLDTVTSVTFGPLDKLEVVNDNDTDIVVMHGAASFVAKFDNGHGAGIVDIDGDFVHFAEGVANAREFFVGEITSAHFPVVDTRDVRNHTVDNFAGGHFH